MPEFEMKFTTLPLLFLVQLAAVYLAVRAAKRNNRLQGGGWINALLMILVLWGAATTAIALSGGYRTETFLAAHPTFWLPFIPVVLVLTPLILFAPARDAVRRLIDATPVSALIGIHALRITALGGLYKAWQGEFSLAFALWVGIPDLLFGLSALVMLWFAYRQRLGSASLMIWNLLGILVILPGAPLVAQLQLPGLLFSHSATPPMSTLYDFPMVLAPSLVVPLFVMFNMLALFRLLERSWQGRGAHAPKLRASRP